MLTQIIFLIFNCGRASTISQFSARNPSNFKSLLFCITITSSYIVASVFGDLILSYIIDENSNSNTTTRALTITGHFLFLLSTFFFLMIGMFPSSIYDKGKVDEKNIYFSCCPILFQTVDPDDFEITLPINKSKGEDKKNNVQKSNDSEQQTDDEQNKSNNLTSKKDIWGIIFQCIGGLLVIIIILPIFFILIVACTVLTLGLPIWFLCYLWDIPDKITFVKSAISEFKDNIGLWEVGCSIWYHCFQHDYPNHLHNLAYKFWCCSLPPVVSSIIHVLSTFAFLFCSIAAFAFEIAVAHRAEIYPLNPGFRTAFVIITYICLVIDIICVIILISFIFSMCCYNPKGEEKWSDKIFNRYSLFSTELILLGLVLMNIYLYWTSIILIDLIYIFTEISN